MGDDKLRDVTILGVHPVVAADELFDETVRMQWGSDLAGEALKDARQRVREHFEGLYLIELQLDPPSAEVNWMAFTQPQIGQPESSWQVPYDEQPVNPLEGKWAFFLHFVDPSRPLQTPAGERSLPVPSPCPPRLAHLAYEAP